jgi:hypothetical protein
VGGTLDSTATLDIIPSGLRDVKFYDESGVSVSQAVTFFGRDVGLIKNMSIRVGLNGVADFNGNVNAFDFNNDITISKNQDSITELVISNDNSGTDIVHTSLSLYDGSTQKAFMEYWNNSEEMHIGTLGANSKVIIESGNGIEAIVIDEFQHVEITPANNATGLGISGVQKPQITLHSSTDDTSSCGEIRFVELDASSGKIIRHNGNQNLLEFINRIGGVNVEIMGIANNGIIIGDLGDDSTPNELLHIIDDVAGATAIRLDNDDEDGLTRIDFYDGTTLGAHFQYANNGNLFQIGTDEAAGEVALMSDANVEAIRIDDGQRVGIGTSTPDTSSILDLTSTTGALLVPRMTTTQRIALTAVNGMIVYDTLTNMFYFRENGIWVTK